MKTSTIPIRPFAALKLATLAALGFALLLLNACHWVGVEGDGHVTTEDRPVTDFTRVEVDGAFSVTWKPGPAKLSITTDKNLLEYIRTTQAGEQLHIEWVKPLRGTHGIKIDVNSPALSRTQLNGAVRFNATNLSGPEFYLEGNGASRVVLTGNVNAMSADLNGASRMDAESLKTRAMEVSISGAGRADVTASDALKVSISGAGKVTYAGNPTISKDISGAGKVEQRQ